MNTGSVLWQMAARFALLSLLSFGGVNVILPDAHRFVVDTQHWLTDQQFADFFAIAQAAPGPNFLLFALIGWHVAGVLGAITATLAVIVPAGTLAFLVGGLWHRFRNAPWRRAMQTGLAPVTIGLIFSSALVLSVAADHDYLTFAVTVITAVVALGTKFNPLWLFLAAGVLGIFVMS
ncbi:MAG TPA: chromate transporter [Stellaceae bacterium]|nr:chromate transporter [Stellaceae bacterium]